MPNQELSEITEITLQYVYRVYSYLPGMFHMSTLYFQTSFLSFSIQLWKINLSRMFLEFCERPYSNIVYGESSSVGNNLALSLVLSMSMSDNDHSLAYRPSIVKCTKKGIGDFRNICKQECERNAWIISSSLTTAPN